MNSRDILELIMLVKSCKNNLDRRYNHKFDKQVSEVCNKFCRKHKINITHGSAYKELRHKSYYYIAKNIESIIYEFDDIYDLYEHGVISGDDVVKKMFKIKSRRFKV